LYRELLSERAPDIHVPFMQERGASCCHIMPVLLPEGTDRFQFMEGMKAEGVQTSIHYPPIHHFKNYEGQMQFLKTDLGVTENVGRREVTLPLYPAMKDEDVEIIVNAIQNQIAKMK
jgi:dTDP-4-amino-4,6-dideoxygalactose transaminase